MAFDNNPGGLPSNLDPSSNKMINGKLYTRQKDQSEDAEAQYLGFPDAKALHESRGEVDWDYPETWVPGDNSPGMSGWDIAKMIGLMAAAGAGGSALAGIGAGGGAGALGGGVQGLGSGMAGTTLAGGAALPGASGALAAGGTGLGGTVAGGLGAAGIAAPAAAGAAAGGSAAPAALAGGKVGLTTGAGGVQLVGGATPGIVSGQIAAPAGGISTASRLAGMLGGGGTGNGWADLALKAGTGALGAYSQSKQQGNNLELEQARLAQNQKQFEATQGLSREQFAANQNQRQAENAAASGQQDPLAQQKSRQKQALLASLLGTYSPTSFADGKFSGGMHNVNAQTFAPAMSFLTPESLQEAEGAFTKNAQGASGGKYVAPNLGSVGYDSYKDQLAALLGGRR